MPNVGGKRFPYTVQGMAEAEQERNKVNQGAGGSPNSISVSGPGALGAPKASTPYGNMQQPMFNGMGVGGQSMSGPPPMAGQQGPTGIPILDDFWEDFTTPPSFLDGLLHFPGGILEAQKYYKHKDEIMPNLYTNN